MNDLSIPEWTAILRDIIPEDCKNQRPFVCDGFKNPNDCDIIIIGKNPATRLGVSWLKCFWNAQSGFRYEVFDKVYSEARSESKKKSRSETRVFFEYIRAKGYNCIETNVYQDEATRRDFNRKQAISNLTVLQALIRNIPRLKGIIFHGSDAQKKLDSCTLGVPTRVQTLLTCHFSYGKNKGCADAIKAHLDAFCANLKG